MLISNIINDSFGLITKQLRFYCWHFRRDLDQHQRQELIQLLYEQHFERLATKIRTLHGNAIADSRQQIGKLLFDHCLTRNRRHQLIQLIESKLVDIDVRLDNYGRTLLHRAAYNLDVDLVKILIDHDVNIRLRDYAGNTALHIAIQSYRNGALIFGSGPDVVENLTSIIRMLLVADEKNLTRYEKRNADNRKRVKLMPQQPYSKSTDQNHQDSQKYSHLQQQKYAKQSPPQSTTNQSHLPQQQKKQHQSFSKEAPKFILDHNANLIYNPPRSSPARQSLDSRISVNIKHNDDNDKQRHRSNSSEMNCIEKEAQNSMNNGNSTGVINPILLEDAASPLIDTKNAFGRTALHYCVLVVGEQHLAHFVKLLISFGADTDAVDTRMKTPLYCLVKRPGVAAIRQKCLALGHLIETGCDDLGLALDKPEEVFTEEYISSIEKNISHILQSQVENSQEKIFSPRITFKRVPSLKHLARLTLIRVSDKGSQLKRQTKLSLPCWAPNSLHEYMNRKIIDQSELF